MGVASIFRKYSYAEIFVLRALYSRTNLRTRHWRVLDMQCRKIPMCRLFCMVCPELLLYWLFYDNNKRSQNVADEKPVIRLFIIAFWLRFILYDRVNIGFSYFLQWSQCSRK